MSFYLLKSTKDRGYVGDMLIDTNKIEQIALGVKEDSFFLAISFDSKNDAAAKFHTVDEAKKAIKEMLKDKISDQDLNDLLPQEEDEKDKKTKELVLKIKEMMA